jgi:hypothetical protein
VLQAANPDRNKLKALFDNFKDSVKIFFKDAKQNYFKGENAWKGYGALFLIIAIIALSADD